MILLHSTSMHQQSEQTSSSGSLIIKLSKGTHRFPNYVTHVHHHTIICIRNHLLIGRFRCAVRRRRRLSTAVCSRIWCAIYFYIPPTKTTLTPLSPARGRRRSNWMWEVEVRRVGMAIKIITCLVRDVNWVLCTVELFNICNHRPLNEPPHLIPNPPRNTLCMSQRCYIVAKEYYLSRATTKTVAEGGEGGGAVAAAQSQPPFHHSAPAPVRLL